MVRAPVVFIALVVPANLFMPSPSAAQTLRPGDWIAVNSFALVHRRAEGFLDSISDGKLYFREGRGSRMVRVPLHTVTELRGALDESHGTLRGAFFGLFGGLIMAIIIDEATGERDQNQHLIEPRWGMRFAIAGTGIGVGAALGRLVRVKKWVDIPIASLR